MPRPPFQSVSSYTPHSTWTKSQQQGQTLCSLGPSLYKDLHDLPVQVCLIEHERRSCRPACHWEPPPACACEPPQAGKLQCLKLQRLLIQSGESRCCWFPPAWRLFGKLFVMYHKQSSWWQHMVLLQLNLGRDLCTAPQVPPLAKFSGKHVIDHHTRLSTFKPNTPLETKRTSHWWWEY